MRVQILFFGAVREAAGTAAQAMDIPEGSKVGDLLAQLRTSVKRFSEYEKSVAVAVNREYAGVETVLNDGDELAVLPPVSGGSGVEASEDRSCARIVHAPIESSEVVIALTHRDVGAVLVFEGVVRDNSRGRRTLYLDYEAYEPMAVTELHRLVAQARRDFAIADAVIVHRVGRLEVGETSVLIAVASPHRGAAFDACRWLIDTLKKTVPIWKREYFEGGAVWADGEPFPEELRPVPADTADEA